MIIGSDLAASGGSAAYRFGPQRGRVGNSMGPFVSYPSPFFDIAHTYLPPTYKALFRMLRYYFFTQPLLNTVVYKLSEYPITDIIIDHPRKPVAKMWYEYLQDHLLIRQNQVEVGLDYHVYGIAFTTLSFPFAKYLRCVHCKWSKRAEETQIHWQYMNHHFRLTCPQCGEIDNAEAWDSYIKNPYGIRIVRLSPEDIEIAYNDISGESTYYYTLPVQLRNDIIAGKKSTVSRLPQLYLQSVRERKSVILSSNMVFVMKRPGISTFDRGWGTPLLLPALKDTFYLQIMKKAQEAIMLQRIVPCNVLFPQAASGSSDPFSSINLVDWKDHVAAEIARWKLDPNYYPILPLPIGQETLGGDGKALLLTQEIATLNEQLVVGLGVPKEIIYGGASWSGSNVSLRIVENMFIGNLVGHKGLLRFIIGHIANFLDWPLVAARHKPFKMADDLQRKQLNVQLKQLGEISSTTLLNDFDYDPEEENQFKRLESAARIEADRVTMIANAEVQGEVQKVMARYQAEAQQAAMVAQTSQPVQGEAGSMGGGAPSVPAEMQSPLQMGQGAGIDLMQLAQMQAQTLSQLDPQAQEMALANLAQVQGPEFATLVRRMLQQNAPQQAPGGPTDMRPLPEQRAPRRALSPV